MSRKTKVLCGVQVKAVTSLEASSILRYGSKLPNYRGHTLSCIKRDFHHCFNLYVSMKKEVRRGHTYLSHYTAFIGKSRTKVNIVKCVLEDKNGQHWHAPDHPVGQCPFHDYYRGPEDDRSEM